MNNFLNLAKLNKNFIESNIPYFYSYLGNRHIFQAGK